MSEPFLGQLLLVGFNFAPTGWMIAEGQILPISDYAALFSLLGNMYGGNGTSNFALPNLQCSVAVGFGQGAGLDNYVQGSTGGSPTVTLTVAETPIHTHTPMAVEAIGVTNAAGGDSFAGSEGGSIYSTSTSPLTGMSAAAVSTFGSSLPHNNMMPYLGMYWIIASEGIFPTRN